MAPSLPEVYLSCFGFRFSFVIWDSSFITQRLHRIDSGCATRRQPAREAGHEQKQERNGGKCPRVAWADTEEHAAQQPGGGQRAAQARQDAADASGKPPDAGFHPACGTFRFQPRRRFRRPSPCPALLVIPEQNEARITQTLIALQRRLTFQVLPPDLPQFPGRLDGWWPKQQHVDKAEDRRGGGDAQTE